jgi:hypothetical protein
MYYRLQIFNCPGPFIFQTGCGNGVTLNKAFFIDDFLDDFPTVTKEQAIGILELTGK